MTDWQEHDFLKQLLILAYSLSRRFHILTPFWIRSSLFISLSEKPQVPSFKCHSLYIKFAFRSSQIAKECSSQIYNFYTLLHSNEHLNYIKQNYHNGFYTKRGKIVSIRDNRH